MTHHWTTGVLVSAVLAATPAGASILLDIPGIPGDAPDPGHELEIVVSSMSLSGGQAFPKKGPKLCGAPSAKTRVSGVEMTKRSDVASAKLFMAAAEGTLFPKVTITFTDAASKGLPSDQYELTNAFIGDYSVSGEEDDGIEESLTLYFTSLKYTHFNPEESATWAFCGTP